jgi:magnesium chelatase family protein
MAFATARTVSLRGAQGHLIDVQVDVSPGVVGTVLVGRPDASLNEARDRVKMAVNNSVPPWPASRRTTVLLAPADLPKTGSHFDLAIAVAAKAAAIGAGLGHPDPEGRREPPIEGTALEDTVFIGELSLSGGIRPVPGVLPMVIAASAAGVRRVVVPETQAGEAALVPGMEVYGVRSLAQVVALLRGEDLPEAPEAPASRSAAVVAWRGAEARDQVDMIDLEGMWEARYAVEVAAAGGHHLMLSGPRGAGKTTLAERIPTVLPDLDVEQALEVTALHSLAGTLDPSAGLVRRPPFLAPHHDASKASILGGGSGRVRPGAVSLAHHGILFIDEFPLLRADVVDALRQPLESGEVTLARGEQMATFPARSMVVLAANPCPCGNYDASATAPCECPETARRRYRAKLSGPMADRVDIWRNLGAQSPHVARNPLRPPVDSATVRARVEAARDRQAVRHRDRPWSLNAAVPGPVLTADLPLTRQGQALLDDQQASGLLTRRGVTRVQRVAWTVSDLLGVERPGEAEVEVALRLRTGRSLPQHVLEAAG